MKKILAIFLAIGLTLGLAPMALAQEPAPTSLTIGTVTEMSGYFYSDLWGSNTSDMDVRGLIHGYGTIAWQKEGNYAVDPTVVSDFTTGLDTMQNKVYRFTLQNDLRWNNGEPVTVNDYLFTVLLQSSPEIKALGVVNANYEHLNGWDAYSQNSAAPFAGVHRVSDTSFTLTVKAQYLPYFYELMLVNVQPTPMAVVAPGVTIADDGDGAYLSVGEGAAFSAETLRKSLLDPAAGYVFHPQLTCGPFSLQSYDAETHTAEFEKNPYFKGNYEGRVSEMNHLTFRPVKNDTMLDELRGGQVDIINKVSDGAVIGQGLQMVNEELARSVTYMRSGFAFLAFACEDATTSQASVRQALADSVDVDALCTTVMNGYAMPVYGYYGLGQWMANQDTERLATLNKYSYDPIGAKQVLINDGWKYNAEGKPFAEGTDDVRYKNIDDQLTPLELRLALSNDSAVAANITQQLTDAAKTLGAKLTITDLRFSELLRHYYRQTDRTYNMFLMGTNFAHVFDPYYAFNTADEFQGSTNTSGLRDTKLMNRAQEMRSVENGDVETYLERWYAFQERWVDLLPLIPLYSNVYFDFVRPDLYSYDINAHWGWSSAIVYVSFTEPAVEDVAVAVDGAGADTTILP